MRWRYWSRRYSAFTSGGISGKAATGSSKQTASISCGFIANRLAIGEPLTRIPAEFDNTSLLTRSDLHQWEGRHGVVETDREYFLRIHCEQVSNRRTFDANTS